MARWQIQSRGHDLLVPSGIKSISLIDSWFILLSLRSQGRTIRKVMGGGGGEFSSCSNFFSLSNSLYDFFWPWHEYFLGLIGVHDFFSFNCPLREYFFCSLPPPPLPPPISFLMVRPLQGLAIETCYSEEFVQHHSSHRSATLT